MRVDEVEGEVLAGDAGIESQDEASDLQTEESMAVVSKAITLIADEIDSVSAGLKELKERHKDVVYDVTTTVGMDSAKKARAEIREPRFRVERSRKAAKKELTALGKQIDQRAAEITVEIRAIEDPIDNMIKKEEERTEATRIAKQNAEILRERTIREKIAEITAMPAAAGRDIEKIGAAIDRLSGMTLDADTFNEFLERAEQEYAAAMAALQAMLKEELDAKERREEMARREAEMAAEREKMAQQAADRETYMALSDKISVLGKTDGKASFEMAESIALIDDISEHAKAVLPTDLASAIAASATGTKSVLEAWIGIAKQREELQQASAKIQEEEARAKVRKMEEEAAVAKAAKDKADAEALAAKEKADREAAEKRAADEKAAREAKEAQDKRDAEARAAEDERKRVEAEKAAAAEKARVADRKAKRKAKLDQMKLEGLSSDPATMLAMLLGCAATAVECWTPISAEEIEVHEDLRTAVDCCGVRS